MLAVSESFAQKKEMKCEELLQQFYLRKITQLKAVSKQMLKSWRVSAIQITCSISKNIKINFCSKCIPYFVLFAISLRIYTLLYLCNLSQNKSICLKKVLYRPGLEMSNITIYTKTRTKINKNLYV